MEKKMENQPDIHENRLLTIARDLFFDSISPEKLKGLTDKEKEKIKYYYNCLENGIELPIPFPNEEETIKMAV